MTVFSKLWFRRSSLIVAPECTIAIDARMNDTSNHVPVYASMTISAKRSDFSASIRHRSRGFDRLGHDFERRPMDFE